MYVSPQSQTSPDLQTDLQADDTQVAAQAASAEPLHPIDEGMLIKVHNMLGFLLQTHVDPTDALVILFDFLNTGSEESYADAVRWAGKSRSLALPPPPPAAARAPGPAARAPSLHASHSSASWPDHSWPEKALLCKDGGAHVQLILGHRHIWHNADEGINRGFRRLPPGCMDHVPPPESPSGTPLSRDEFRTWHLTHHLNPAVQALRPHQVLLMAGPEARGLLLGRRDSGELFGVTVSESAFSGSQPKPRVMDERGLNQELDKMRAMGAAPSNWALLKPR